MRELKFRSWANGSMWDVNGLACSDNSDHMDLVDDSIGGEIYVKDFEELEYRVIMQYTGLKDKHGREIYEGDILDDGTGLEVAQWAEDYAGFRAYCGISKEHYFIDSGSHVIVGNIYEHPQLLGDKK